jgi:hypothetical protein
MNQTDNDIVSRGKASKSKIPIKKRQWQRHRKLETSSKKYDLKQQPGMDWDRGT